MPVPMLNSSTGEVEQVDESQVPALYQAGTHQLSDEPLHMVSADGQVGTLDPSQASQAFAAGMRVASPDEVRAAKLDAKYGGIGGSLAALGEGAARGLTLGASDPLAVGAAGLFGGQKAAEATRQHLAEEKEANPGLSTLGEVGGSLAPLLASGGATAEESVPQVAKALTEGVRTLGVAPRAVTAAGDVAEHAVANVLGGAASGTLGRAAQAAASQAARGIVEGGLFAGGAEISDATLENRPLVAEKLLSAVGHGALTGGLLGGVLGGAGTFAKEGASAALGKISPKLDEAANAQAARWAGVDDRAASRVGGASEVGNTVLDEVLKPAIAEGGMHAAAMSPEAKLEAIQKATNRVGGQIGDMVRGTDATVPLEDMLKPIEDRIAKVGKQIGREGDVKALQDLRESVKRVLGVEEPGQVAGRVERTPEEIRDYLKANPEVLQQAANGALPEHVRFKGFEPGKTPGPTMVPIADAIEQRRSLQQLAFKEAKALDPKLRVQMLREVSTEWNNLEERAINEASADHAMGTQLRDLNRKFGQLKIAEDAAQEQISRGGAGLNTKDILLGAVHAPGALLAGHPLAAGAAVASSFAHQALREHGNAYAALMLDRLSTWGGISKAVQETNEGVDAALKTAMAGRRPMGRPTSAKPMSNGTLSSRFEKESDRIQTLSRAAPAVLAAHLQHATNSMAMHAPQLQQAVVSQASRATQYLAKALPSQAPDPSSLTPHLDEPKASPEQQIQFLRKVQAVEEGPPGILKRLATGKFTPEDVDVMRNVYPETLKEVQTKVAEACADRTKPVPFPLRIRYGTLLGIQTDPTLEPGVMSAIQGAYAAAAPKPQPPAEGKSGKSKNIDKTATAHAGMVESAMYNQA